MFKLGRSRAVASALNASRAQIAAGQRRNLSIHEYLSADLLRQVTNSPSPFCANLYSFVPGLRACVLLVSMSMAMGNDGGSDK